MSRTLRGHASTRVAVASLVFAGVCVSLAEAAKDETTLISRQSTADGAAGGDNATSDVSISADGRYVAFRSFADNLSGVDATGMTDIFVRDTQTNETTLVSRETGAAGPAADDDSEDPAISADGRFVVFESDADNLSADANPSFVNVFVRDLETDTTTLVSRETGAAGIGAADHSDGTGPPGISADGRFVAFMSEANNLSTEENEAFLNVFVRDTQSNTTILASRATGAAGLGAGADSNTSAISANGRFVGFQTQADNLAAGQDNSAGNVFLRDLETGSTELISRMSTSEGGAGADGNSSFPAISADGRYVAFNSVAENLIGGHFDETCLDPTPPSELNCAQVYLRDRTTSETKLISRVGDELLAGEGSSDHAAISADGRYIAFESDADNLSTADADATNDIFVSDATTMEITLVSRQSAGEGAAAGEDDSSDPEISSTGRFVAFESTADNLSTVDGDVFSDAFLRDVLGDGIVPPVDNPDPPDPPGDDPDPLDPPGPGPGPSGDAIPPDLGASAKKHQKLGKPVKVTVSCNEACSVTATGTVKPSGSAAPKRAKTLALKSAGAQLAAGETGKLKLKPSRKVARKLKAAAKAKAKVSVIATDLAGNTTQASATATLR